jgi:phosphate-selective porin OprO/OprP
MSRTRLKSILTSASLGIAVVVGVCEQTESAGPQNSPNVHQDSTEPEPARHGDLPEQTAVAEPLGGSLEERLMALEKAWREKEAADQAAQKEAQAKQAADAKKPTFHIGGRIHLDHWSFADDSEGIHFFENPATGADPEDRFYFRRIRLEMEGDVKDNMEYRLQIDFHSPAEGEMKDVYIGFNELPFFQTVLIGNQKRPLGLDHLNSSRFNVFIERPLVVEAFNEDARRMGIAAYGVSEDEVYHWRYGVFSLETATLDGEVIGDSQQMSFNARLSSSPWYDDCSEGRNYFHWAVAGVFARPDGDADPDDTNANEGRFRTRGEVRSDRRWIDTGAIAGAEAYEILGLESILNLGPLQVVGEYQFNWLQRDGTTTGTGPDVYFHGAYAYIAYMLTGEHVPYERDSGTIGRIRPSTNFFLVDRREDDAESGWGAWQVALRYSYLDLTDQDIRGGVEDNWTLGLVWYFNPYSSLQFNAVYGEIDQHAAVGGFTNGHFTALGTRLRVDF